MLCRVLLWYIIIIIVYFDCKWVFTRWQWYYNKTLNTNNTQHTQTKHSTQNYTNDKGRIKHNAYKENTLTPTTDTIATTIIKINVNKKYVNYTLKSNLRYYSTIYPEGQRKAKSHNIENSLCFGKYSNRAPP
jgi:hypothetical protein